MYNLHNCIQCVCTKATHVSLNCSLYAKLCKFQCTCVKLIYTAYHLCATMTITGLTGHENYLSDIINILSNEKIYLYQCRYKEKYPRLRYLYKDKSYLVWLEKHLPCWHLSIEIISTMLQQFCA